MNCRLFKCYPACAIVWLFVICQCIYRPTQASEYVYFTKDKFNDTVQAYGLISSSFVFKHTDNQTNISDEVFIIYLPGDNIYRDFEDSIHCSWAYTPNFLKRLLDEIPNSVLIRTCSEYKSQTIEWLKKHTVVKQEKSIAVEKLEGRVREVQLLLDGMIAKGADPRKIFVVGHSFGGWVSLVLAKQSPLKLNAVIVSAPSSSQRVDMNRVHADIAQTSHACSQLGSGFDQYVCQLRDTEQFKLFTDVMKKNMDAYMDDLTNQIDYLKKDNHYMPALVFAYPTDVYNKPEQINWLAAIPGVEFIVESCLEEDGHSTFYHECFERKNIQKITAFIINNLSVKSA
ncbi:MAG: alpha/beta hydrolase [Pseudomonadota bacterium]|nr:alpha/beta hydrolase [Pseudomonadota bacterium]